MTSKRCTGSWLREQLNDASEDGLGIYSERDLLLGSVIEWEGQYQIQA